MCMLNRKRYMYIRADFVFFVQRGFIKKIYSLECGVVTLYWRRMTNCNLRLGSYLSQLLSVFSCRYEHINIYSRACNIKQNLMERLDFFLKFWMDIQQQKVGDVCFQL